MAQPETLGKIAEVGGSVMAVTCGLCRWIAVNHDFLAGLGIIAGFLIALAGLGVNWYYNHQRMRLDLRLKPRRSTSN